MDYCGLYIIKLEKIIMKKSLILWFAMLTILFIASCKTAQPTIHDTTTIAIAEVTAKDSTKVIDRSLAISDSLNVVIGNLRTGNNLCDSLCKIEVERLLMQINTIKKSGTNSSQVFYDKKTNSINVIATVGENKNENTQTNKSSVAKTAKTQIKEVAVPAEFSKEQKFNLATGRFFWLFLLLYCGLRLYKFTATIT